MSAKDQWRDLALQFDNHRIEALQVLRGLLAGDDRAHEAAKAFLSRPPLSGPAVLERESVQSFTEGYLAGRAAMEAGGPVQSPRDAWEASQARARVHAERVSS